MHRKIWHDIENEKMVISLANVSFEYSDTESCMKPDNPSILPIDINMITFVVLEPESKTINTSEVPLNDVFSPEVLNVTNRKDLSVLKKLACIL